MKDRFVLCAFFGTLMTSALPAAEQATLQAKHNTLFIAGGDRNQWVG